MKRIILALFVLATSSVLGYNTTRAVWTDTVTVSNNQIQTGTADLQVSIDNGGVQNTTTGASSMILSGLIPGGSNNGYSFSLWNNSTTGVNFGVKGQITAVTGIDPVVTNPSKLEIAVYETGATPGLTTTASSAWISLADWQTTTRDLNSVLTPGTGNTKNYRVAVRLLSDADNEWQGKTVTMTFTVTGTQP